MTAESDPNSLDVFIDRKDPSDWSAQIVNRTEPEPIGNLIEELFTGLDIPTTERDLAGITDDLFLLIRDGEVVESSPLEALKDTLLLVNSDSYKTGTRSIGEIDVPDVVMELSDTVFTLEGYPDAHAEKLVLTLIARYVEHQALSHETGTLRTSFQRLSRIDDERGTRDVYERLGQTAGLETHVYGFPDWKPPAEFDLTVHGVTHDEILNYWFVVYHADTAQSVAMLAKRIGVNTWTGYWTFDADEIASMDEYVGRLF
jgi:hypothetical protein